MILIYIDAMKKNLVTATVLVLVVVCLGGCVSSPESAAAQIVSEDSYIQTSTDCKYFNIPHSSVQTEECVKRIFKSKVVDYCVENKLRQVECVKLEKEVIRRIIYYADGSNEEQRKLNEKAK